MINETTEPASDYAVIIAQREEIAGLRDQLVKTLDTLEKVRHSRVEIYHECLALRAELAENKEES